MFLTLMLLNMTLLYWLMTPKAPRNKHLIVFIELPNEQVLIRNTPLAHLHSIFSTSVQRAHVYKIECNTACISLFTSDDNVIDIWINPSAFEQVSQHAKQLFPQALFVLNVATSKL